MTDDLKQHLLPDELALHAAEQAATPGMIEAKYPRSEDFRAVRLFTGTTYLASVCNSDMDEDEIKANADLIALSRNMVPVLLQRLAESRAEVARLNRIIEDNHWHDLTSAAIEEQT